VKEKLKPGNSKAHSFKLSIKYSGNKVHNANSELVNETITGSETAGLKTAGQYCNSFVDIAGISLGIATKLQSKHILNKLFLKAIKVQ